MSTDVKLKKITLERDMKLSLEQQGKRVQFNDRVKVHHIFHWTFAHKMARCGNCWIQNAVDRERFQHRIQNLALIIEPILAKKM